MIKVGLQKLKLGNEIQESCTLQTKLCKGRAIGRMYTQSMSQIEDNTKVIILYFCSSCGSHLSENIERISNEDN